LLEVVYPLVLQHQIEEAGEVGDGNEDEVEDEREERVRDGLHDVTVQERTHVGCTHFVQQVEWPAECEEWRRDHDQQEVLDHVIAEVLHIKVTND
jgi:hypothetical protein